MTLQQQRDNFLKREQQVNQKLKEFEDARSKERQDL